VARIEENGLAGIADHYITLEPAPRSHPMIPSGGTIPVSQSYAEVSLDQVFDTLDPLTRAGVRNIIRGEAAAIVGRSSQASRALEYLAPGLYSTSQVTRELSRSEPAFDALLVRGARTMSALASRSQQLTALVASTDQATGAIASQSSALSTTLALLPATLRRSTATFAGLRSTLTSLNPVVSAAKPAARNLGAFSVGLHQLADVSIPTVNALNALIRSPSGSGDLISLLNQTPGLAQLSAKTAPEVIAALNASQPQLSYLRAYTPDVVAALANVGQASAYYDANGHYTRTQPWFGAFGLNANSQLTAQPPSARYQGLRVIHGRCPGGAVQPTPDGSAPVATAGCSAASSPSGT
jgi:phospholipid/cholesterol/gamma-HCH transport system substrate-binding protein